MLFNKSFLFKLSVMAYKRMCGTACVHPSSLPTYLSTYLPIHISPTYSHTISLSASFSLHSDILKPTVECCSNERSYLRYYGLLGQRFCMMQVQSWERVRVRAMVLFAAIHRVFLHWLWNEFDDLFSCTVMTCHVISWYSSSQVCVCPH